MTKIESPIPVPRETSVSDSPRKRDKTGVPSFDTASPNPDTATILGDLGWKSETRGEVTVNVRHRKDPVLETDPITGSAHGEGYRLNLSADKKGFTADIDYATPRGLRYALYTLDECFRDTGDYRTEVYPRTVLDGPRFPIRGIIEGYYGPPWSPAARDSLMTLMTRNKMNAYFYGPKDDEFHRRRWRDPYTGPALQELEALVDRSRELDLDFWYTTGPGLSMEYSREDDVRDLLAKFDQLRSMGITRFGLLFDDIPDRLQHEADKAAYPDLARAHADVGNRVFRALKERDTSTRLALCPTQYHGDGNETYINLLGDQLDPRIDLFWTGPEICSRRLDLADTADLARRVDRPPLFWDNYPVNDCGMTLELHIGPYRGRDVHLYRASAGIVANGMEHPESSKIGLMTVAAYLWNPEAYNPEAAWERALVEVVGRDEAEAFRVFADNNRYSCLYREESPDLRGDLEKWEFLRYQGKRKEAARVLDTTIHRLGKAVALFDNGMANADLEREIRPWVGKFRKGVALLEAMAKFGKSADQANRETLFKAGKAYATDPYYVFADVLDGVLDAFLADNHE